MLPGTRAIDRYIIRAVLPYICMALAVLSVILLIQQSAKVAELLGPSEAPLRLALEVTLGLLPGILVFSLPASVLVGVATGFSQMGHDSELTALSAAGVGNVRVVAPALLLGLLLSLLTLHVAFNVAPASARDMRDVALRAALYRLESPVEPKSFYTGIPGKVIFVREGDKDRGEWRKIFIHWREADGQVRLVTARSGRLDFSGDRTELVLADSVVTTLPAGGAAAIERGSHVTVERSNSLRLRDDRLSFGRDSLARRMREREPELDELGWAGLSQKIKTAGGAKKREAEIALHKRLALGLSPIIFAFFGACLGLKVVRGGRSQGVLLSLAFMVVYYLVSLAGEQLARGGVVAPFMGPWLPFVLSLAGGILLLAGRRRTSARPFGLINLRPVELAGGEWRKARGGYFSTLGLVDKTIFRSLTLNFLLVLSALTLIFLIFTVSELLRSIAANHVRLSTVSLYLFYLLPLVLIAIIPVSTLLSVLITFALLVRRNEMTAWWSSGQSVFRLMLPCVFFAGTVGGVVWFVQDQVLPASDRRQNSLRDFIRSGVSPTEVAPGRVWVSSSDSKRIYTFDSVSAGGQLDNLVVFNFDPEGTELDSVIFSSKGLTEGPNLEAKGAEVVGLSGGGVNCSHLPSYSVEGEGDLMVSGLRRPTEFSFAALSAYIKALKAKGADVQSLSVALERRRAEPFFPLVMTLLGAPLALLFGRRGALLALCAAIAAGLLFLGLMSALQELGVRELLTPGAAVWPPPVLFLAAGVYLLSRSQT